MADGLDSQDRYDVAGAHIMVHDYGDEVVVANLTTGWFYSLTGTHRSVWTLLADGYSSSEIATACADSSESSLHALDDVVTTARTAGLLDIRSRPIPSSAAPTVTWQPGGIESFDDLQDALLLDPVHDVNEAGWPHADSGGTRP